MRERSITWTLNRLLKEALEKCGENQEQLRRNHKAGEHKSEAVKCDLCQKERIA